MPVARFDAKTTEWSFAHLVDRAQEVEWWLRLAKADGAYINRPDAGAYYPDFIVIDSVGVHWLVETKADDSIQNLDVQLKAEAARVWARSVSDSGEFGSWRYMLVSENHLKNAGSWSALVNLAYTED
jgi:type III restriction enzyme